MITHTFDIDHKIQQLLWKMQETELAIKVLDKGRGSEPPVGTAAVTAPVCEAGKYIFCIF